MNKYFVKRLIYNLTLKEILTDFFSAIGVQWTLIEILNFFMGDNFHKIVQQRWWIGVLIAFAYVIFDALPKKRYIFKLPNNDCTINLEIEDCFRLRGGLIIPINNRFDVNAGGYLLAANSVLSKFVKQFFDGKPELLQHEVDIELRKSSTQTNQTEEFPIGTVIPIVANNKNFFLLASSQLNSSKRSETTPDNLVDALQGLWNFLAVNSGKETFIVPIFGTGKGKLILKREDVVQAIVLSFLQAIINRNFTETLVISIHPEDVQKNKMNLDHLSKWISMTVDNPGIMIQR